LDFLIVATWKWADVSFGASSAAGTHRTAMFRDQSIIL
jgi:hypothetical protein